MKQIAITGQDVQLKNALEKNIGSFEGLEIVLSMPYGEEMLENLSFAQPDFVICDLLSDECVKNILDQCLNTTVVFISDDVNRCASTITTFNKEGYYNFINLDKNKVDPKGVLELLQNYESNDNNDFEEVSISEVSEIAETKIEPISVAHESTPQSFESRPEFVEEVREEAPTPKPISEFTEQVQHKVNNNEGKVNSAKLNAVGQCQVISIFSKKGGTGKSTIAKEMANIFSGITLSKKISDKSNLDVCVLDLNFEQADIRTITGITNPNPNLYIFLDAIVSRMESGIPLEKIYFSAPEVKTNYCLDANNGQFKVICLGQGDIPKKLVERIQAFNDEELLTKLIRKIIKTLKDVFNVLILDTSSSYNDITEVAFRNSSKIVYVLEPNLTDLDNLKTFLDGTKESNFVTNKIIPFLNKDVKSRFRDTYFTIYEDLQSKNPELMGLNAIAPYDTQISVYNNDYSYYTNVQSKFKQALILTCSNILPIFRVKNISQDLRILEQKRKAEAKKRKELEIKNATKKFNKEKAINDIKNPEAPLNTGGTPVHETPTDTSESLDGMTIASYLQSDLSKKDIDTFLSDLEKCVGVKHTKKGFPMVTKQPKSLDKKVWKVYYKRLSKNIK